MFGYNFKKNNRPSKTKILHVKARLSLGKTLMNSTELKRDQDNNQILYIITKRTSNI